MSIIQSMLTKTDSYKVSHYKQFPEKLEYSQYYITSRGGKFRKMMVAGMVALARLLNERVTVAEVEQAQRLYKRHFGQDLFNYDGWMTIATELEGKLPLSFRALPEGSIVDVKTPIAVIENTDPRFGWLPGWVETVALRSAWYASTVATTSAHAKAVMMQYYLNTGSDMNALPFALHDFGARGATSSEAAQIGGAAHLYNFLGTDTVESLLYLETLYPELADADQAAGVSIPAREHSTTTIYGEAGEDQAFQNSIDNWGSGVYACVMDSYDYVSAVHRATSGSMKQSVLDAGGRFVIRPDSGNPVDVVMQALNIAGSNVGTSATELGYKVLHPSYRVIQGDGVDLAEIRRILSWMESKGWAAENVNFGMGGGLLQKCDRDTLKFAMKMCCAVVDGESRKVFKNPKTDPGKASLGGYIDVARGAVITGDAFGERGADSDLKQYYIDGEMPYRPTLDEVRKRASQDVFRYKVAMVSNIG
ncbi:nicotinamide phosphoribosyl transferase [Vibrio phage EniLVp02]